MVNFFVTIIYLFWGIIHHIRLFEIQTHYKAIDKIRSSRNAEIFIEK